MPTISAKKQKNQRGSCNIVFVVYPGVKLLDIAGPLQVFNDVVNEAGKSLYQPVIASLDGTRITTDTCIVLDSESLSDWKRRQIDTLIIVGGGGVHEASNDQTLKRAISLLSSRARRIGSVCNGAFLLASCGLLNERRATTHWESTAELATRYPRVLVEKDSIYINDHEVWTSAGVTAGIDMALAMVSADHGRLVALSLAKSLVTFFVRPGGQSQFSAALDLQESDADARFDELHRWVQSNLDKDLRVEQLAHKANMSPRHFSRLYVSATGSTPAKAIEALRVEAARRMLEDENLPISTIACRCGFGDDERMRRSFIRILKVPPQKYLNSVRAS